MSFRPDFIRDKILVCWSTANIDGLTALRSTISIQSLAIMALGYCKGCKMYLNTMDLETMCRKCKT